MRRLSEPAIRLSAGAALLYLCVLGPSFGGAAAPVRQAEKTPKKAAREVRPPRELTKGQAVRFPSPAPTGVIAKVPCSQQGDIYAAFNTTPPYPGSLPPDPTSLPVRKLSLDSQTITEYAAKSLDGYQSFYRVAFNVGPWGELYALYKAYRQAHQLSAFVPSDLVIVKFDDDGSVDSRVKLTGLPSGRLTPTDFDVFADGSFLVTGDLDNSTLPVQEPGESHVPKIKIVHHPLPGQRPFTGIFDAQGRFVQELHLPGDVGSNPREEVSSEKGLPAGHGASINGKEQNEAGTSPSDWPMAIELSLSASDPQNTIYILRPSDPAMLYEISSSGQVVCQARVKLPAKGVSPVQMGLAGKSRLFITFGGTTVDEQGRPHLDMIFARVDPATGKIDATYRLPPDTNLMPACADGPNELLFLGSTKNGNLEVVEYSAN
jgi:hypothetical protein